MERYSILSQDAEGLPSATLASPEPVPSLALPRDVLQFPGEDGGQSLAAMAERDLEAALRLLAERAQYITAASGSAIALLQNGAMICRASSGVSGVQAGMRLEEGAGLAVEAVKCGQMLRCDDAQTDPRVNTQSCRLLGVISAMAMPLRRGDEVVGAFELVSGKVRAFEEHDVAAMQRLGEMIQTALEHAEAARRTAGDLDLAPQIEPDMPCETPGATESIDPVEEIEPKAQAEITPAVVERGNVGKCQVCGFPVSGLRQVCLDCEPSRTAPDPEPGSQAEGGALPLEALASDEKPAKAERRVYKYLLGVALAVLIAAALLLWLR